MSPQGHAEDARAGCPSQPRVAEARAQAVAAVFDHLETALPRQGVEAIQLGGLAERVRDQQGPCALADGFAGALGVEREAIGMHVYEYWLRARFPEPASGGGRQESGTDYLVTILELERLRQETEGVGGRAQGEDVLRANVFGDGPLESIRFLSRLAPVDDVVELGCGIAAGLEGYVHANERVRGPQLVQVVLDTADELVDHVQVDLAHVVLLVGGREFARHHVAAALSESQPRTAVRAEKVDGLEQTEPAVAADGERDLCVYAESDCELWPDTVFEPADDLLSELVSAARRYGSPVADLQDLRAEVALSATFHPDERDHAVAALQEPLEHAKRAIRAADQQNSRSRVVHSRSPLRSFRSVWV